MLSKAKARWIKSLQVKKYRLAEQRFTVEGAKSVAELLASSLKVEWVIGTRSFLDDHADLLRNRSIQFDEVTPEELQSVGAFQTNDAALAVAVIPATEPFTWHRGEWVLALDDIRDPGNLGTMLRIADWYGIRHVLASAGTADLYNSKVITASMGSFLRVTVHYVDLAAVLRSAPGKVLGAMLNGTSVYDYSFGPDGGVIVIGNEAHGVSPEVQATFNGSLTIPRVGQAESLNAAVATAILLDNMTRNSRP
ncbi:MAG: RNA methyltransferase [Cyclobacteriaceae bacterium]|nr:RNA methyltransferase [Cyclobacteriaceae bacterium]